jgi:hypothetical protein
LVPIGFGNPIAYKRFAFAGGNRAASCREIANAADGLALRFEFDGPSGVVVEHGSDNLQTHFNGTVRWPAGARANVGVGGVFEKGLGVIIAPRAE